MRAFKVVTWVIPFLLGVSLMLPSNSEAYFFPEFNPSSKSLAHYAMGNIYDLMDEYEMAVAEYEQALNYDKESYLIHLRLGADYARLGMLSQAIRELNLVKTYNPADLQSRYLLALIYSTQKDYLKAAEEYEFILKSFVDLEPKNIEIYGYLGQLYYSQKKYDQAIEQFERILTIEPKNADVMYLLGSIYLEMNKRDQAVEYFKNSISVDPDHDGSLNSLGYMYAEDNINLDEAIDLTQRAIDLDPDNGAYLDSLGWVYYKKEMYDKALEAFKKAHELLKDPVIYEHLGDVYYKLNDTAQALKYWELSLELLPGQAQVIEKVNNVKNNQVSNLQTPLSN